MTFDLPGLIVDRASRTITREGEVVARWSRFGRFLKMNPSYKIRHEVVSELDASGIAPRAIRRAKLFVERVEAL